MISAHTPRPASPAGLVFPSEVLRALALLLDASECARAVQRPAWDFAEGRAGLRAAGLTDARPRWLACRGLVEVATETTRAGQPHRSFRPDSPVFLGERTGVVLTATGIAAARAARATPLTFPAAAEGASPRGKHGRRRLVPRWHARNRTLWLGEEVIKRFPRPAPIPEILLAAFQEQRWPRCIDHPLPGKDGLVSEQRLHDAVVNFNRRLPNGALCFRVAAGGRAVSGALRTDSIP
jgi:hypothetical protein